jgi:ergothioneine biosynthesis protein EgtB
LKQSAAQMALREVSGTPDFFHAVRAQTLALCEPLEIDDYAVQSMPDASPIKWHLAHTTWFFEQFVLRRWIDDYAPFDARFDAIFNSYYRTLGTPHARNQRHVLTRPTLRTVAQYRTAIDEQIATLLDSRPDDAELRELVTLGLHHEQQHQELILTDIKHAFFCNPLHPAYATRDPKPIIFEPSDELRFVEIDADVREVGAVADTSFAFDNERPRHRVCIGPFALSTRLVTNAEYLAFVRTGGYRRPEYWLADGWEWVATHNWSRPLYWQESLDSEFTLYGVEALRLDAPVCHLSYYEADAFARWASMRLPTEFEWEAVANDKPIAGNFVEGNSLHPLPAGRIDASTPRQLFGDVWEWTASAYAPYPGYAPQGGALGEYNGKFMCSQQVLRGGSCLTPHAHVRATYRNFFHPDARWQMSGIRLAR